MDCRLHCCSVSNAVYSQRGNSVKNLAKTADLDLLNRYCVIDQLTLAKFWPVFNRFDADQDDILEFDELYDALLAVTKNALSDHEMAYLFNVLGLTINPDKVCAAIWSMSLSILTSCIRERGSGPTVLQKTQIRGRGSSAISDFQA